MRSASGLQISGAIGGEDLSNKIKRHRRVSEEVRKPLNGLWREIVIDKLELGTYGG